MLLQEYKNGTACAQSVLPVAIEEHTAESLVWTEVGKLWEMVGTAKE